MTLADFWGIDSKLDDDQGTSLVMVNSLKGEEYFKKILDKVVWKEMKIDDILEGNICLENSVDINPKSRAFLEDLDTLSFTHALEKYTKENFRHKVKRLSKSILKKFL